MYAQNVQISLTHLISQIKALRDSSLESIKSEVQKWSVAEPTSGMDLIKKLLDPDPKKRITVAEALR